jgi:ABC-type dipeptide/oligopeptide/nickel transport system permease component
MLEVLDSDYVKLARVKGVAERRVVWLHALKNCADPVSSPSRASTSRSS